VENNANFKALNNAKVLLGHKIVEGVGTVDLWRVMTSADQPT
jgi:hypothetical protein